MIKAAMEEVVRMSLVQQIFVGSRQYTSKQIFPVLDPHPGILKIDTLTGFQDYIEANIDTLPIPGGLMVHIQDHLNVFLVSKLTGEFLQRFAYILVTADPVKFSFGQFMDVESFVVRVQSMFVQDAATEAILKIVGNLTDGKVTNFKDDGVSQQVTARSGVSKVENIEVPNPVELAPFRTFLEIDQPKSRFIFRMRSGAEAPACALFEADGGAWKNEAVIRIREWLKDRVGGIAIIA